MREQDGAVSFPHRMEGVLDDVEPIGNLVLYYITITIGEKPYMVSEEAAREAVEKRGLLGKAVVVTFQPPWIHLFDPETEIAVYDAEWL